MLNAHLTPQEKAAAKARSGRASSPPPRSHSAAPKSRKYDRLDKVTYDFRDRGKPRPEVVGVLEKLPSVFAFLRNYKVDAGGWNASCLHQEIIFVHSDSMFGFGSQCFEIPRLWLCSWTTQAPAARPTQSRSSVPRSKIHDRLRFLSSTLLPFLFLEGPPLNNLRRLKLMPLTEVASTRSCTMAATSTASAAT